MWQRGKLEILDVFWKILKELKREGLETESYQIHRLIKTGGTVDMPLSRLLRRLRRGFAESRNVWPAGIT